MDDETRRHYDYISNGLKAESPEGIFTRAQIDQASVFYWGNTLTDERKHQVWSLENAEHLLDDPVELAEDIERINARYAEQKETFTRKLEAAVTQLYRENGIPVEDNSLSQEQTIKKINEPTPERKEQTYAEFLQNRDSKPELTGGDLVKGRREQSFAEYLAAKKEEGEKEPEKHNLDLRPTQEQVRKLTPGF